MARKKSATKYLTDQSPAELEGLVSFLSEKISDMEDDEDLVEEYGGESLLPSLRGLVVYLRQEYLEEDEEEELEDACLDLEEEFDAEADGELDF